MLQASSWADTWRVEQRPQYMQKYGSASLDVLG
jgi:hypothetical protein